MTEKILNRIKDREFPNRDLLIDTLSDSFERNLFSIEEQCSVISELISVLHGENNDSVVESIFNLLGVAFYNDVCIDSIAEVSSTLLNCLSPGSLVHALPIIGDSNLPNKKDLIEPYLASENKSVKEVAQEAMHCL